MITDKNIILFDGICNLCNGFVDFVIQRDPKGVFVFGSIQSDEGEELLKDLGIEKGLKTVIYIEENKIYTESTAALKIIRKLNGLWPFFYIFILIPPFMRNGIYRWIARNRYKWFGKRSACRLPEGAFKERFL